MGGIQQPRVLAERGEPQSVHRILVKIAKGLGGERIYQS